MQIKDLQVGDEILLFMLFSKKYFIGKVHTIDTEKNIFYCEYINEDGEEKRVPLGMWEYKKFYKWGSEKTWCTADNTKFKNHVFNVWNPKIPNKKEYTKYINYNHDNNKHQLEEKLKKQKKFINKVMEQGYAWYVAYDEHQKRTWEKIDNPRIEFIDNNYFLCTPCGFTCVKKEGKTLSLNKPE